MRFALPPCVAVVAVVVVAGCSSGPSHDSVMRDTVGSMRRGVELLKGVSDEPSAIEAKPQLLAVQKELRQSKARLEKLERPTPKQMERLAAKYEAELDRLSSEFEREARRISADRKVARHIVGATTLP